MNSYSLPANLESEIEEFDKMIKDYLKGDVNPVAMKAYRVPFGVYEQRKDNTFMVRVRCAAGFITPAQLVKVAELSERFAEGSIHLTTRQEVQIHSVDLTDVVAIIRELKSVGLATRGGGGNTVRNISAQIDGGVDPDEIFDVTPYSFALTTRLIAEGDSWNLPRKYKIAFSGSDSDKAIATINDLGFIARIKDGKRGFKVYVAGGMGAKSALSKVLFEFVEEEEVYNIAKAIKNLFFKYGNRKNKHAARLRFLWKQLGEEEFRRIFNDEYEAVQAENHSPLKIVELENSAAIKTGFAAAQPTDVADFELWKGRYVKGQKQAGLYSITVPIRLGFIKGEAAKKLADFLTNFGENVLRIAREQNFEVRNIPEEYLANLYNFLCEQPEEYNRPLLIDQMVACAGSSTCKLGICLSREAAGKVSERLIRSRVNLDEAQGVQIKISGCPNSCGHHPIADLGFFGKASRKDGYMYPAYNVVGGAVVAEGKSRLAEKIGEVSARDLPDFTADILADFVEKEGLYPTFKEYLEGELKSGVAEILAKYGDVPHFDDDKNYYFDWQAQKLFSMADRGVGECSAGLFDLIDFDKDNIKATGDKLSGTLSAEERATHLRDLLFYSARMLLITRGIEPKSSDEVYDHFRESFIEAGLVESKYKDLVELGKTGDMSALAARESEIEELSQQVIALYDSMDNSLQFKIDKERAAEGTAEPEVESSAPQEEASDRRLKDLRGVACPMNFVKTKIELAKMKKGELLEIYLDDGAPINNVPGSVKSEGHRVLEQKQVDNYWSVLIEKG